MSAFRDSAAAVGERKRAPLEARTQPSVKNTVRHADTLSGVEVGSILVSAACRSSQRVPEVHKVSVLESEVDRTAFFDALKNPPKPNHRLREAFELREQLIANAD